jgi:hypothetical protein
MVGTQIPVQWQAGAVPTVVRVQPWLQAASGTCCLPFKPSVAMVSGCRPKWMSLFLPGAEGRAHCCSQPAPSSWSCGSEIWPLWSYRSLHDSQGDLLLWMLRPTQGAPTAAGPLEDLTLAIMCSCLGGAIPLFSQGSLAVCKMGATRPPQRDRRYNLGWRPG